MNSILGLENLHFSQIEIIDNSFMIHDFTFNKAKMKQFEKYLDLSWCDEMDRRIILKSNVSNFSIYNRGEGAYENKIVFHIGLFDSIFATVPQDIFGDIMELINNR